MVRSFVLPLSAAAKRLSTVTLNYAARVVADGASAYWRLGELSGTAALESIGGSNGSILGGVTLGQPGAIADGNPSMLFDNLTSGRISTVASMPVPLVSSIEGWLKIADLSTFRPIFTTQGVGGATGDTVSAEVNLGAAYFSTSLGAATATGTAGKVVAGVFNHLVFVLNGSTVTFYVNGVLDVAVALVRATPSAGPGFLGFAPAHIGLTGYLDDVAIYPRALTAAEIAAHYTRGLTPPVDPAASDIPYRQLVVQALGATAYLGDSSGVTPATGIPVSALPTSIGPYRTGPVKLSQLYAVGAGATLNILGVPF